MAGSAHPRAAMARTLTRRRPPQARTLPRSPTATVRRRTGWVSSLVVLKSMTPIDVLFAAVSDVTATVPETDPDEILTMAG